MTVIFAAGLMLMPDPGLVDLPTQPISTTFEMTGWWSQYSEPISQLQAQYHGYWPDGYYVALPDCSLVGSLVWITVNDSDWQRVRVFDCLGADGDPALWGDGELIGELSYSLAVRFGVAGRGGVRGKVVR